MDKQEIFKSFIFVLTSYKKIKSSWLIFLKKIRDQSKNYGKFFKKNRGRKEIDYKSEEGHCTII